MPLFINVLVNLWRLVRNVLVRLLRRPPEYVSFEVAGALPEFERTSTFLRRRLVPGPQPLSLEKLRERLDLLSTEPRVKGAILRIRNLDADWAALEELRGEILRVRERGKRVVVYLVEADTRTYYLACAADEIYATPLATLNVTGLRTRVNFLRDALERVGVSAEVVAVSPYKSAGDTFVRNDFSEQSREQAERLLENRYSILIDAIAEGRKMSQDEVRQSIDGAPYSATAALDERLVDVVCYEDELPSRLGEGDERARIAEWEVARRSFKRPYRRRARRKVGLVTMSGTIVRGRSRRLPVPVPLLGGEQAGDESVVGTLRAAERNRRVAAILFHVDSRGGDALASDLIWREVERIRVKKPVVVLMGAAAASGGYYVSAAANSIIARANTITGSIGVITIRPTATELYGKLGVNPIMLGRGARSTILDTSQSPTEEEIEVLRQQIQTIYDEFKDRVTCGREMPPETLEEIAGGRVWTGTEARELGLVDEIGGFRSALHKARELAGIDQNGPEVLLKVSPPRGGHPAPGDLAEAARDTLEGVCQAASEFGRTRIWTISPYEVSDR